MTVDENTIRQIKQQTINEAAIVEYQRKGELLEPDIIKEKVEDFIEITHWEDLFDLYKKSKEFSDKREETEDRPEGKNIFGFIFRVWCLWITLSKASKKHKNRYEEVIEQAQEFYGDLPSNQDEEETHVKTKKTKNEVKNHIFYF